MDFYLFVSGEALGCEVRNLLVRHGGHWKDYGFDCCTTTGETGDVVTLIGLRYHP